MRREGQARWGQVRAGGRRKDARWGKERERELVRVHTNKDARKGSTWRERWSMRTTVGK